MTQEHRRARTIRRLATGTCKTQKQHAPNDDTGAPSSQNLEWGRFRPWSDHDLRPSRTRRSAKLDRRASGTTKARKNTRFRANPTSQKRISCETSSKSVTWSYAKGSNCARPPSKTKLPEHLEIQLSQPCCCDSWHQVILYLKWSSTEVVLYLKRFFTEVILYLTWFFTEMILYLKWTSTWSDPLLKWFSTWSDSLLEVILYLKWSDSLLSSMSVTRKFLNDSMMKAWHAMRMYQRKAVMVYWRYGMH